MQAGDAPRSLLLVDDSRDYCTLVERAFRLAKSGTAVFPIPDGQSAIEHLVLCGSQRPVPDLVLLDRVMPGGPDGYDVLRAIRSLKALSALPVLMISGSDDEQHIDEARKAGASGYIVKPSVKDDYPQLARQVLEWWRTRESWPEVGPKLAGSCLALPDARIGSSPAMALTSEVSSLFPPHAEDRSLMAKIVGFVDWVKETATASQDPFQAALNAACRRHLLRPAQAQRPGGSQRLLENRRLVIVDLLVDGWPDETILEELPINATELKRLKARARQKVGPKLDRCRNSLAGP